MNQLLKKAVIMVLVFVSLVVSLSACKTEQSSMSGQSNTQGDFLKKQANMIMYLIGDPPRDFQTVSEELNKLIKKDLNASLTINYMSWGDYTTKYPLLIASGESFDLIYSSEWAFYKDQVQKDGFLELDNLLPKYAPELWKEIPKEAWKQATYKGKIYMVPANSKDYAGQGFAIRGDLRKKYNVPEVKDLDSFEAYMDAIKKNEKGMIPFNAGVSDGSVIYDAIPFKENYIRLAVDNFVVSIQNPNKVSMRTSTQEYLDFVKKMQMWQQKGYFSKDVLSNRDGSKVLFENGKSASAILNVTNAQLEYVTLSKKHPDWELEYFDFDDIRPGKVLNPYINNGMSVNRLAPNPERAVMLLEKLHNDSQYYDLTTYGIRGKHYDLSSDGKLTLPAGITESNNGFPPDSASPWGWRESKFYKSAENSWAFLDNKKKEVYDKKEVFNPASGFIFNKEPVASEIAAMTQALKQYQPPLLWGFVEPEQGLQTLNEKLKEAGVEKVQKELQKQWSEYLNSNK